MVQLLILLKQGILSTLLDVDNAVYMTSRIKNLSFKKQKQAIIWGLLIEFIGRIALIGFLGSLLSENKVFFTLVGVKFTPDSISLFIAGAFLLYKSSGDLYEFLTKREQPQQLQPLEASFWRIMGEMAVVNLILSIDAIIVVSARASDFPSMIVIFAISAIIRLCSLEKLAQFIHKYSSINIFISIFMILVGLELFLQGLWFEFPEEIFNAVMVLAIVLTVIDRRRRSQLLSLRD